MTDNNMTDNERLVWAAAYAAELTRLVLKPQRYQEEDSGVPFIGTAVENAWAAVTYLRDNQEYIKESFGEDDEVYQMLREMLE